MPKVKSEIMKTPLGPRLQRSEKGFHGAIGRLVDDKEVVRYKAHLMSADANRRFQADLKAGLVRDLRVPNVAHHSPMGDAVLAMMKQRERGAESGHIKWELKKNPEFTEQMIKNPTHVYNVLKRLVEKGDLVKRKNRYFYVHLKSAVPDSSESGATDNHGGGTGSPSLTESDENAISLTLFPGAVPAQAGE